MTGPRSRGIEIRNFIIENVAHVPGDIARKTAQHFAISRQAVSKHIAALIKSGIIESLGETRSRQYTLKVLTERDYIFELKHKLAEDKIWRESVLPHLTKLPRNSLNILHYGVTEMINNAIDHSGGKKLVILLAQTAATTRISVLDVGEGIFRKIQRELRLSDTREAIFELAKGKLTTDPAKHSGEGIFFTSRAVDRFTILSGGLCLSHEVRKDNNWLTEVGKPGPGTMVSLLVLHNTARTLQSVFDRFTSKDGNYGFDKTIVPVNLARYEGETLISRSQAKRILTRFERFKTVLLDFQGVDSIGQAFADEIFRVFAKIHPKVELIPVHANRQVKSMIARSLAHDNNR